jgi:gas vesicle protein
MHQRDSEQYLTASLVSFLAGSIIGAGIALLFAPQSGEYTRREMREKAERTIIKMHRMEDDLKHTMRDVMRTIRRTAAHLADEGKDLAELKKREILEAVATGTRVLDNESGNRAPVKQKA